MESKLKPCPFCGGRAHRRTIKIEENLSDRTGKVEVLFKRTGEIIKRRVIECRENKCFLKPSTWLYLNTTRWGDAIKAWNRRSV